jgi:hypothetical protein
LRRNKDVRVMEQEETETYESWALYRSQNCLESWQQCCIVNPGPVLTEVKFPNDTGTFPLI